MITKDELYKMIWVDKLTYKVIAEHLGYTCDNAVKKKAKSLGINLPQRITYNGHNKKELKKYYCKNCDKELVIKKFKKKYCDDKCHSEFSYKNYIKKWKLKEVSGNNSGNQCAINAYVRKYLHEKYGEKCCKCGWSERNPVTNKVPLQVNHIDGNHTNSFEENLNLLCPNCHSLTPNYGILNKGNGRKTRHGGIVHR